MSIYECLGRCISDNDINNTQAVKTCTSDCQPDTFTAPMIWVGFYIAAASLVCLLTMGTDLVNGIRMKKYWFPCKSFTLNAAISALLAIALKMPVDLSSPMPCGRDQLMKLSATALMSVSMGNFIPSLAGMSDLELVANLMALTVFIVPLIANIGIQIGTGVIYSGASPHHIIIILCIVFQFALLVSTAIACPTIRQQLQDAYNKEAKSTNSNSEEEEELKKQWIMAQTSNPQFAIARSVICTASGAICLLTLLALAHAMYSLYITMSKKLMFFHPDSDYEWSAYVIVSVQAAAVLVASISPISRWFRVVWYKLELECCQKSIPKELCTVEPYWTKRLNDLRKFKPDFNSDIVNNIISKGNNMAMDFLIIFQIFTVTSCKLFRLVCLVFLFPLMFLYQKIFNHKNDTVLYQPSWVLKTANEPKLPNSTIKKIITVFNRYLKKGEKEAISLKQNFNDLLKNFDGVKEFDKELIEGLTKITIEGVSTYNNNNPNGSWAIMIVTLSTIVRAIKANWDWEEEFVSTVNDILPLVIYVEKALGPSQADVELDFAINMWKDVLKHKKWLDIELPIKSDDGCLKTKLQNIIIRLPTKDKEDSPHQLATGWMKETARVVLQFLNRDDIQLDLDIENKKEEEEEEEEDKLCEKMTVMVLDIFVACLVKLDRAITANISNASIEKRELVLQRAVSIYGKTLAIQEIAKERLSFIFRSSDHQEYLHASWWKVVIPKTPLDYAIDTSRKKTKGHQTDIESRISISN